jgi:hypothetical protein
MKKRSLIIYLLCVITLYSCMDRIDDHEIKVNNESKNSIFAIVSIDDKMKSSMTYIDYCESNKPNRGDSSIVFTKTLPNSIEQISGRPRSWDGLFDRAKDKKIRLFIIQIDSVKKYGWDKIFDKNLFNKKISLTLEELKSSDWEIVYYGN